MASEPANEEVEIRLAFQEQALEAVHLALARQERRIAELEAEVTRLRELLRALAPSPLAPGGEEPPPPHY